MNSTEVVDVCIVGAGIAGSTCAFYLAKKVMNVLLLEKKKFPRDKICGDAITPRAQIHLKRMGVLDSVLQEKKGQLVKNYDGGSLLNSSTGEVISAHEIAIEVKAIDSVIPDTKLELEEIQENAAKYYKYRNVCLLVGFVLVLVSKVWGAYT